MSIFRQDVLYYGIMLYLHQSGLNMLWTNSIVTYDEINWNDCLRIYILFDDFHFGIFRVMELMRLYPMKVCCICGLWVFIVFSGTSCFQWIKLTSLYLVCFFHRIIENIWPLNWLPQDIKTKWVCKVVIYCS